MGNILGGTGGNFASGPSGQGLGYGPELQCCDAVVDPISLLTTIGAIAAVSLFLRQAVIDNMVTMAKRRKRSTFLGIASKGTEIFFFGEIVLAVNSKLGHINTDFFKLVNCFEL